MPTFRRVVHSDHASALSGRAESDPLVREAILLDPLHRLQVACDQIARKVEDDIRTRQGFGLSGLSDELLAYLADERKAITKHADLAALVHQTAQAMIADLDNQIADLTGVPVPAAPARRRGPGRRPKPSNEVPADAQNEVETQDSEETEGTEEASETSEEDGGLN